MPRAKISEPTLKALFAKSGNVCAFPGCNHELVTDENVVVSQVCHIEAANPLGERYNPESDDQFRSSFQNLIVLCYKHHKITNDVIRYPVDLLKKMKADHEHKYGHLAFQIADSVLNELLDEDKQYWAEIEALVDREHELPELAFNIPINNNLIADFEDLLESLSNMRALHESVTKSNEEKLKILIQFIENNSDWPPSEEQKHQLTSEITRLDFEESYIGIPNWMNQTEIKLIRTAVHALSVLIKISPQNSELKAKRDDLRSRLRDSMMNNGLID